MPNFNGDITLSTSVSDLDRSINWFKDMLGFDLIYRADEVGWAEMASPAKGVTIGVGQNESPEGRGGTTPVFGVDSVDEARAEIEAKGVTFDGDTVEIPGMVKLATFFDPDGNTYMLAEDLSEAPLA